MQPTIAGRPCGHVLPGVHPNLAGARRWHWALLAVAVLWGCAGDGASSGSDDPMVVATFRGGVVRRADLDKYRQRAAVDDPQVAEHDERDWREESIREIALRKALADEAPAKEDDPILSAAQDQAVAVVLIEAMHQELGWNQITVTLEEARAQYDAHPEQYKDPERLRLQYIFLRAAADEMTDAEREEVRQQLEGIRQQVLTGADFEDLARQHSQSSRAPGGGWLTLSPDEDVHPSFRDAAWALEMNEVSEIIEMPTGFLIAKLVDRIPAIDREFENVIEFARRRAVAEKLKAAQDAFVREVGPRYDLVQRYDRLSDPSLDRNEALISIGDYHYTFEDLDAGLPETYLSHLYAGHFAKVYERLDQVTCEKLLVLEARRLGLPEREDVAARIGDAVQSARYDRALRLLLELVAADVPEEELREYYEQNQQRYQTLRTRDVDVILLKPEGDESLWWTLRRGEALVERIRAGEDFAEVARKYSRHYSAANGGRIEHITNYGVAWWIGPRAWVTAVLNSLKEGEVADPQMAEVYDPDRLTFVETGVIIVRLVKDYPPRQAPFEEVVDMVRDNYLRRHYQEMTDQVRQQVLDSIDLRIYADRLPPI